MLNQTQGSSLVHVLANPSALDGLGARLDGLQEATGCPVTARRPWQQAWMRSYADWQPLVVAVEEDGRLEAVAPLAWRRTAGVDRVVAIGHGPSDEVRLPARDARAALLLGQALGDILAARRRPWRLVLRQLPPYDDVAAAVASRLPHAVIVPGDVSPQLVVGPDRSVRANVSRNHHQQVRRLTNRLDRAGIGTEACQLRLPGEIAAVLPEVREVCRGRDAQLGRSSAMDDAQAGPFFDQVLVGLAERGEVELTTLRLDHALAAYVLCFLDGGAWRMWHCRLAPRWEAYGAGRLCHHAALAAALRNPNCGVYDFMRGDEPYKWSMSNSATRGIDLLAASGPVQWSAWSAARWGRHALKQLRERSPLVAAAWERARPVLRVTGLR